MTLGSLLIAVSSLGPLDNKSISLADDFDLELLFQQASCPVSTVGVGLGR